MIEAAAAERERKKKEKQDALEQKVAEREQKKKMKLDEKQRKEEEREAVRKRKSEGGGTEQSVSEQAEKISKKTKKSSTAVAATSDSTSSSSIAIAPVTSSASVATSSVTTESLFEGANQLNDEDKMTIQTFLTGNRTNPFPSQGAIRQITLRSEMKTVPDGSGTFSTYVEQLIFEINYEHGTWRKLRRRRNAAKESNALTFLASLAVDRQSS